MKPLPVRFHSPVFGSVCARHAPQLVTQGRTTGNHRTYLKDQHAAILNLGSQNSPPISAKPPGVYHEFLYGPSYIGDIESDSGNESDIVGDNQPIRKNCTNGPEKFEQYSNEIVGDNSSTLPPREDQLTVGKHKIRHDTTLESISSTAETEAHTKLTIVQQSTVCKVFARHITGQYNIKHGNQSYTPENSTIVQFTAILEDGSKPVHIAWRNEADIKPKKEARNKSLFSVEYNDVLINSEAKSSQEIDARNTHSGGIDVNNVDEKDVKHTHNVTLQSSGKQYMSTQAHASRQRRRNRNSQTSSASLDSVTNHRSFQHRRSITRDRSEKPILIKRKDSGNRHSQTNPNSGNTAVWQERKNDVHIPRKKYPKKVKPTKEVITDQNVPRKDTSSDIIHKKHNKNIRTQSSHHKHEKRMNGSPESRDPYHKTMRIEAKKKEDIIPKTKESSNSASISTKYEDSFETCTSETNPQKSSNSKYTCSYSFDTATPISKSEPTDEDSDRRFANSDLMGEKFTDGRSFSEDISGTYLALSGVKEYSSLTEDTSDSTAWVIKPITIDRSIQKSNNYTTPNTNSRKKSDRLVVKDDSFTGNEKFKNESDDEVNSKVSKINHTPSDNNRQTPPKVQKWPRGKLDDCLFQTQSLDETVYKEKPSNDRLSQSLEDNMTISTESTVTSTSTTNREPSSKVVNHTNQTNNHKVTCSSNPDPKFDLSNVTYISSDALIDNSSYLPIKCDMGYQKPAPNSTVDAAHHPALHTDMKQLYSDALKNNNVTQVKNSSQNDLSPETCDQTYDNDQNQSKSGIGFTVSNSKTFLREVTTNDAYDASKHSKSSSSSMSCDIDSEIANSSTSSSEATQDSREINPLSIYASSVSKCVKNSNKVHTKAETTSLKLSRHRVEYDHLIPQSKHPMVTSPKTFISGTTSPNSSSSIEQNGTEIYVQQDHQNKNMQSRGRISPKVMNHEYNTPNERLSNKRDTRGTNEPLCDKKYDISLKPNTPGDNGNKSTRYENRTHSSCKQSISKKTSLNSLHKTSSIQSSSETSRIPAWEVLHSKNSGSESDSISSETNDSTSCSDSPMSEHKAQTSRAKRDGQTIKNKNCNDGTESNQMKPAQTTIPTSSLIFSQIKGRDVASVNDNVVNAIFIAKNNESSYSASSGNLPVTNGSSRSGSSQCVNETTLKKPEKVTFPKNDYISSDSSDYSSSESPTSVDIGSGRFLQNRRSPLVNVSQGTEKHDSKSSKLSMKVETPRKIYITEESSNSSVESSSSDSSIQNEFERRPDVHKNIPGNLSDTICSGTTKMAKDIAKKHYAKKGSSSRRSVYGSLEVNPECCRSEVETPLTLPFALDLYTTTNKSNVSIGKSEKSSSSDEATGSECTTDSTGSESSENSSCSSPDAARDTHTPNTPSTFSQANNVMHNLSDRNEAPSDSQKFNRKTLNPSKSFSMSSSSASSASLSTSSASSDSSDSPIPVTKIDSKQNIPSRSRSYRKSPDKLQQKTPSASSGSGTSLSDSSSSLEANAQVKIKSAANSQRIMPNTHDHRWSDGSSVETESVGGSLSGHSSVQHVSSDPRLARRSKGIVRKYQSDGYIKTAQLQDKYNSTSYEVTPAEGSYSEISSSDDISDNSSLLESSSVTSLTETNCDTSYTETISVTGSTETISVTSSTETSSETSSTETSSETSSTENSSDTSSTESSSATSSTESSSETSSTESSSDTSSIQSNSETSSTETISDTSSTEASTGTDSMSESSDSSSLTNLPTVKSSIGKSSDRFEPHSTTRNNSDSGSSSENSSENTSEDSETSTSSGNMSRRKILSSNRDKVIFDSRFKHRSPLEKNHVSSTILNKARVSRSKSGSLGKKVHSSTSSSFSSD